MHRILNHITVYEHDILHLDRGENRINVEQLKALQNYYGNGIPYYSLIHNGVKFNKYVGAIQIGRTLIEVLPKLDKNSDDEKNKWRDILINILRVVGSFKVEAPSSSILRIKPNSILELYYELFINEVEYLLYTGLAKQYRSREGNQNALKGSLQFAKNLQHNLVHKEKFYVRQTVYDVQHKIHFIIYKTIHLLNKINTNATLTSRICNLILNFPEMPDIRVNESTFKEIRYSRKTMVYCNAMEISRLILLHYYPDIIKGSNHVLALMFDMNKLWEKFVYVSLKKLKPADVSITAQSSKDFWKQSNGDKITVRPDIVINKNKKNCIVLDTKWKNLYDNNPSVEDLRQMYVYHEYFGAQQVALVYPGNKTEKKGGIYIDPFTPRAIPMECNIISIGVESNIKSWQLKIGNDLNRLIQFPLKENPI